MPKILSIILVICIFQLSFVPKVQAESYCLGNNPILGYNNPVNGTRNAQTFFPENSGDLKFSFTLVNKDVTNNILGNQPSKWLYLQIPCGLADSCTYKTTPVEVKQGDTTFDLIIDGSSDKTKRGNYDAELYSASNITRTNSNKECYGIKYQVGLNTCRFVIAPNSIAPKAEFYVTFYGKANTEYSIDLESNIGGKPDENLPFSLGGTGDTWLTKTDSSGGGVFKKLSVDKYRGSKFFLRILNQNGDQSDKCFNPIIVSQNAPTQPPFDPAVPIVPGSKVTVSGGPPTKGGSEPCDTTGGRGTAIKTAIGCIHTNPPELIKDFMTFTVGIGGGLAFLMMLLGAFQMLTSAGNPETLNAGKDRLTNAIIGLLFVIFSVLLLQIIGVDILKIPGFGR